MRKILVILALVFSVQAAAPRQANAAIVGFAGGPVGLMVVGWFATVGGAAGSFMFGSENVTCEGFHCYAPSFQDLNKWSFGAMLAGLVLLEDKDTGPSFQFAPLTTEEALKLGVTDFERTTYNSEITEINAIYETIVSEAITAKAMRADFVHARWLDYSHDLSPETVSAVEKVSQSITAKFKKAS